MTTWVILDQTEPDRLVVKYIADDGKRNVVMPMFWDQVTPLEMWLSRVNPFPTPLPMPMGSVVGRTGKSDEPDRTPPIPEAELKKAAPPRDPLTAV
jgi:hypothetical protein